MYLLIVYYCDYNFLKSDFCLQLLPFFCTIVLESGRMKHLKAVLFLLCYIPSKTIKMTSKAVETPVCMIPTEKMEKNLFDSFSVSKERTDFFYQIEI